MTLTDTQNGDKNAQVPISAGYSLTARHTHYIISREEKSDPSLYGGGWGGRSAVTSGSAPGMCTYERA